MRRHRLYYLLVGLLALSFLLVACGGEATPTEEANAESEQTTTEAEEMVTLHVALLPVLDVLPFFIAQESGYFADEGLNVEGIAVSSPIEREQVFEAGEAEGMLTDVIGVAIRNAVEPTAQIVAISRRATEESPLFRILVGPESAVQSPEDLAGVTIGISENSIIQYLGDRLLVQSGLTFDDIEYESVPAIPVRFSLLMEGQLGAAILPDPLAQAAIEAGAVLVLDDTVVAEQELSQSVLVFRNDVVESNPDTVSAFLRAWYRAVDALNENPEDFRQLFLDSATVPESVQDTYAIPPFPVNAVTSEAVWDDVNNWLLEREIIDEPASYESSVDRSFLSE